jgi:predicted DNA binding protein
MISAQFRIQLPPHLWVSELSREFPRAEFVLLSGFEMDGTAIELGETVTESPDAVVDAIRDHPAIESYELLEADSERVLGKYETTQTDLYAFAESSGLTIEFPVEVRNGWYRFDLTGTRDDLDELRAVLDESPLSYDLESLVTSPERESLLTARQREVVEAAVREGYYTVPRECTLSELAKRLDVDKSTASTVLRRAEARLVKWFLSGPEDW